MLKYLHLGETIIQFPEFIECHHMSGERRNYMVIKGFKFGMLLQIAIGPIALFIFQTAATAGFISAITGVVGVVIIDGLFILAAILGIGSLIEKYKNVKKFIKYMGAIVLIVFGLNSIVGVTDKSLIPSLSFFTRLSVDNVFLKTLILTLSNPLTIMFWAGVFSTKIIEENMKKTEMFFFGFGAVISTFFFLTFISIIGYFTNVFLPSSIINLLNIIVGLVLIAFGIKTAVKRL